MSTFDRAHLLSLLPAVYRRLDEEGDGTLGALMAILASQAEALGEDVAQLYDDQFIETCAEWVVPYIADLVGARGVVSIEEASFSARAYVANTLRYRRRKGTVAVIEELARDVTGWPASAVEYFLRLITTQNVNHVRRSNLAAVDLRDWNAIERLDTAFETSAHSADVRRIKTGRGRYNIPNIGVFLWRLQAYPLTNSPAVMVDPKHFLMHPLGIDSPLVTLPETESEIEHLAEPLNVPLPITTRVLDQALARYYGRSLSILIRVGGVEVSNVHVCDLSDASASWQTAPVNEPVALDPKRGRIAFKDAPADDVDVTFHYAFPADLGGGEYERESSFALEDADLVRVPDDHATISAAIAAVGGAAGRRVIIEISDSGRYEENTLTIALADRQVVELRAKNGSRPTLVIRDDWTLTGGAGSQLHLNGLLIAGGGLHVPAAAANHLALLGIAHCTLVPGRRLARDGTPLRPDLPSILVDADNTELRVVLERAISGALHVSPLATSIEAKQSIIDGGAFAPALAVTSGALSFPLTLAGSPAIDVAADDRGAVAVPISAGTFASAGGLALALENALHTGGFADAVVLTDGSRLTVMSGSSRDLVIAAHGADPAAATLMLDAAQARAVRPLISDRLAPTIDFTSPSPQLRVRIGADAPHSIALASGTLAGIRGQLAAAINAIAGAPYADARVFATNQRLIVVPGGANADVVFSAAPTDSTTIRQLGLTGARDAIRADVLGGEKGDAAAPLSLDACTILGGARAVSLPLVSNSIFTAPVAATRKQIGCVRFSYVPEGSSTPRRYRCQADLAFAEEILRIKKKDPNKKLTKSELADLRRAVAAEIVPGFVSTQYGEAAYAQLTLTTPLAIRAGSDRGSEMGVYEMLQQPQREANLRAALDEYLRFGLEAGIFYAS